MTNILDDLIGTPQTPRDHMIKLADEYRATMDKDVLHSWAEETVAAMKAALDTPSPEDIFHAGYDAACSHTNGVRPMGLTARTAWAQYQRVCQALE